MMTMIGMSIRFAIIMLVLVPPVMIIIVVLPAPVKRRVCAARHQARQPTADQGGDDRLWP